ncbi:MAG: hypothetical protein JKY94_09210 [Rhodobacteraceae bacterium]|nr:hypothetical protein [Paracoccaceae bacterium]
MNPNPIIYTAKLPWPPNALSPNKRGNLFAYRRAAKRYKAACGWSLIEWQVKRINAPRLKIHITFYRSTKARHDMDNLIARFKHGQDAIAAQTGVDDAFFDVTHEIAEETGGYVIARIEALVVNVDLRGVVE